MIRDGPSVADCSQVGGADIGMSPRTRGRALRGLTRLPFVLRAAVAILVPALALAACGTAAPKTAPTLSASRAASASASPTPSPTPSPSPKPKKHRRQPLAAHASTPATGSSSSSQSGSGSGAPTASGCQSTFVPAYFYASSIWEQAIDTTPRPTVMLLNVDNGVGTSPLSHFQTLVKQAQDAGITVLGYSSTEYGARAVSSVESEISDYKSWYGVNGIFLDLTQGTSGEFSYYQTLANYIRSTIPGGIVWLNPGSYPDPSFMSIANVVMVFEGSYSSYLSDQVPSWVSQYSPSQFAHVLYDTPQSDFASAVNLSRQRRAGHLFVTDLSGSGNPYGALPSYWSQEASTVSSGC
jgi:Spherulation-specific family 4